MHRIFSVSKLARKPKFYSQTHNYRKVVAHGSLVDERDVAVGDLALALAPFAAGDVAKLLRVFLQSGERGWRGK